MLISLTDLKVETFLGFQVFQARYIFCPSLEIQSKNQVSSGIQLYSQQVLTLEDPEMSIAAQLKMETPDIALPMEDSKPEDLSAC